MYYGRTAEASTKQDESGATAMMLTYYDTGEPSILYDLMTHLDCCRQTSVGHKEDITQRLSRQWILAFARG